MDARVSQTIAGWGAQSALIIQSNSGGWDQYQENAYRDAVDHWKTIVWPVNMAGHAESIQNQDGSLTIRISTNNGSQDEGVLIFFDNFRVVVPRRVSVADWSVF
ncbi:MAG: hypothetical protein C4527_16135 [Candidatus Omnitrophota bacterium]|jgi:hypothetical protein|nr:MAG: hypothetical protein C4527_16135 [Candidatus Omnitrophota bacterium]